MDSISIISYVQICKIARTLLASFLCFLCFAALAFSILCLNRTGVRLDFGSDQCQSSTAGWSYDGLTSWLLHYYASKSALVLWIVSIIHLKSPNVEAEVVPKYFVLDALIATYLSLKARDQAWHY